MNKKTTRTSPLIKPDCGTKQPHVHKTITTAAAAAGSSCNPQQAGQTQKPKRPNKLSVRNRNKKTAESRDTDSKDNGNAGERMPSFRLLLSLTRCRAHENVNDRLESGADAQRTSRVAQRCVVAASNEQHLAAAVGRQDGRTDRQMDRQTDESKQNHVSA